MAEDDVVELKRVPGTCCPEPGCDNWNCLGCEYLGVCRGDPQKIDYCSRPHTCPSCGANCLACPLWNGPVIKADFSKMTEGEALWNLGARPAEKDGKKGLMISGLFIEASDEPPGTIVASDRREDRLKGAKKTRCRDCRRKVWISPSTQEVLKRYPGTPVLCIVCMLKQVEQEKEEGKANGGENSVRASEENRRGDS